MEKVELSAIEKEMLDFNFDGLTVSHAAAKANMIAATSIKDVATEICTVWRQIRKFVILAEGIPGVGKFVTILADLLDSICDIAKKSN